MRKLARTQDNFTTVAPSCAKSAPRAVHHRGEDHDGAASSVAAAIDKAGWEEVVGTVSGDDTIFVATADARAQGRVLERLHDAFESE